MFQSTNQQWNIMIFLLLDNHYLEDHPTDRYLVTTGVIECHDEKLMIRY